MAGDIELFPEGPNNKLTIREHINRYITNWPLFIVSLVVCVGSGYLYLRYTTPKFKATTLLLVKGRAGSAKEDLVENALSGKLKGNFDLDNELELLKAGSLLEKVVSRNNFNISYYHLGRIEKKEIYIDAPFRLIPTNILDSNTFVSLKLNNLTNKGGVIEYGANKDDKKFSFKWNEPFKTAGKTFILANRGSYTKDNTQYLVEWKPVKASAGEIAAKYQVGLLDKNTSIIKLEILIENLKRGTDILDAIAKEYDLTDIEERTVITRNTLRFIDDRLNIISNELSGVEGNLESYQGRNKIINLGTQSSQSFGNANDVSLNIQDIEVKQSVVEMIRSYFNNPSSQDKLVPSSMGLEDGTLSGLISKYNELQLTRQRELPLVATNSTVMQDLNNQLNNVRGSILESLQNISRNLRLQQNSLQQQNGQYQQFLSSLPRKERVMQEIKRKQSITEGLYLYLLQKREEAAISSTSASLSNYKQIEPAKGYGPVEPDSANIKIYTVFLGLILPIGFITLKDLFNEKVTSRNDISKVLHAPVIGDISHITIKNNPNNLSIVSRSIIAEQFRIIRTNLSQLLPKQDNSVILVTSSSSNEGKSFICLNLAGVLAIPGRRVALLKFDLRKIEPENNQVKKLGVSDYLSGNINDLSDLYYTSSEIPTLHIYQSGVPSTNPADLFLNERISNLFTLLKQQYDYIIVDSAPAALVSDAFIIAEYCDSVLYVIRQRVTTKKQLEYVNNIVTTQKLNNVGIIFNDVIVGGKYGYYGYGLTSGYQVYEDGSKKGLLADKS